MCSCSELRGTSFVGLYRGASNDTSRCDKTDVLGQDERQHALASTRRRRESLGCGCVCRYGAWALMNAIEASSTRSVIAGEVGTPITRRPVMTEQLIASITKLALGVILVRCSPGASEFLLRRKKASNIRPSDLRQCPECGNPYSPSDYRGDAEESLCSKCRSPLGGASGSSSENQD